MSPLSLPCVVSKISACVRSQPFCVPVSCRMCGSWLGPRSSDNQLYSCPRWHLFCDVVTHGLQSLLESPSRLVAPVSSVEQAQSAARLRRRSSLRSPLRKAALGHLRGSILLSKREPNIVRPRHRGRSTSSPLHSPAGSLWTISPYHPREQDYRNAWCRFKMF